MLKTTYHKDFVKAFKKLTRIQQNKFYGRLKIFVEDEYNPVLNNHGLKGNYRGFRSINIKGDLRAVYKKEAQETVIFVDIDSHSNLYG